MEQVVVYRDGERDIKFTGELIASVKSTPERQSSNYSGSTGRWSELRLYRTAKGKYVCAQNGFTQWQGESDRYSGAVCESIDQVVEFFGTGRLAKRLYDAAGLDTAVEVE